MKNKLSFLTKMSLKKKIGTKWFLIANLVIFIAIVCLINIDSLIKFFGGDFNEKTEIIVIDNTNISYDLFNDYYNNTINYLGDSINSEVSLGELSVEDYKKKIKDDENKVLLVINSDSKDYLKAEIISYEGIDAIVLQTITTSLNSVRSQTVLSEYNITPEMQANISKSAEITRTRLDDGEENDEMGELLTGVMFPLLILPIYMLTVFLIQMIGAEVNEEKTTKSMEIIISNVSPKVHFFSKVLAGNIFVLIQGFLILFSALVGILIRFIINGGTLIGDMGSQITEITNSLTSSGILDKIVFIIPITLILMILTFIAYSLVAGILASMTTNVEDYQQVQTPIIIISLAGYYLAMMAFMFEGSTFIRILSYLPFISALLSPALLVLGQITLLDVLVSIIIIIIVNYLLIKYGLRIYKVGILNYSSQGLWKKMFKAVKEK